MRVDAKRVPFIARPHPERTSKEMGLQPSRLGIRSWGGIQLRPSAQRWGAGIDCVRVLRLTLVGTLLVTPPVGIHGCAGDCNEMDVRGVGECKVALGYARTPLPSCSCEPVIGCQCQGSDCGQLFASFAECVDTVEFQR